jgi:hypothetical protein
MNEEAKILDIFQVAVPPDTPLTVSYEVKVLEILGIVKDPQLIGAMQLVSAQLPSSTPATLKGLLQMLGALMLMSKRATSSHHSSVAAILSRLDDIPDTNLTFGSFLSVCKKLIEASGKVHKKKVPDKDHNHTKPLFKKK